MTGAGRVRRLAGWARANPAAAFGVAVLATVLVASLYGPLTGYDVRDAGQWEPDRDPGFQHWFGTDRLGRDVFTRLVVASRSFVWPGLLACAVSATLAIPAGALAGYYGGFVEAILRYLFTVLASIPRFVLVLLVLAVYGNTTWWLAIAAGVAYAPILGEAVFARVEALRAADYVVANRAYGVPTWRILWIHLVWAACRRHIARILVNLFGFFLVLETTLAYLGMFGVKEPQPSWGNMMKFEWGYVKWWDPSVLAPAVALWLTIVATAWVSESFEEPSDG